MHRSRTRTAALIVGALALGALTGSDVAAKASAADAAKLGKSLTPMGANAGANADGSIPAWTGGITSPPAGYASRMHHPDPFVGDARVTQITSANLAEYRDKLSPGQIAMFERYPDSWMMNVYPTRRSASYPQTVYDATIANASTAELSEGGNGVTNAQLGIPFPVPNNGTEIIWNHLMRYRGESVHRTIVQAAPNPSGDYTPVVLDEQVLWTYAQPGATIESIDNKLGLFLQEVRSPARLAGRVLLVHETLNQAEEARKAWVYNPGQRRVRRAPNIAYDNPGTASDGLRTNDQLDMFNGAPDRYEWKLVGKQEMYVPYNSYALHSDQVKHDQVLQAGHINPSLSRYELHRVWKVDATVREGTSHIYARRTFYFDEDSWQILAVDQYDGRGAIWRYSEAYTINYYEIPLLWDTLQCHYDLQNGRYLAFGLNNESDVDEFNVELKAQDFTPSALRRMGKR
jgi:hypothetical protein